MIAYLVRRTILAAFTLLIISFVSFIILSLPEGDIVDRYLDSRYRMAGGAPGRTMEDLELLREYWGLRRPLVVQWWSWVSGIVLRGDFGHTYARTGARALEAGDIKILIARYLPFTIYLSLFTIVITWVLAIPIGIYSAVRQHSLGDFLFTFVGFSGLAVPDFLLGLVLMYVAFAYFNHSVGGIFSGDYLNAAWSIGRVVDMLQHMLIPAIVIGTSGTAGLIRIMRNNLLDELGKPYVVTARAKGLASWKLILKYPVRVAINPFISGIGGMLPALLSGDAIVSVVLSLPTMGPVLLEAIQVEDMMVASSIILMYAVLAVIGTLISDLLLVIVDPRIKLTGSARGGGGAV